MQTGVVRQRIAKSAGEGGDLAQDRSSEWHGFRGERQAKGGTHVMDSLVNRWLGGIRESCGTCDISDQRGGLRSLSSPPTP